ncbi:unnamed protein product [Durusdinium trenchii]|uniref:Uncharacterized protein n=1 Tax=Durusdinium trenchii TaxID=1381693 RepID=A0ABP0LBW7_9DINO
MFHIVLLGWQLASAFEVLDVAPPRTGTQSLRAALDILGYKTLHSGSETWSRKPWCQYLFRNGTLEAALPILDEYDAAMDEPFHLLYQEVMAAFPESKFVYTLRDPDSWFASYDQLLSGLHGRQATVGKLLRGVKRHLHIPLGELDPDRRMTAEEENDEDLNQECLQSHYWGCRFGVPDTEDSKQQCIESYWSHLRNLTVAIPKDRLLMFNMSDGWAPLCNFLGKPIPKLPFPYVDHMMDDLKPWTSLVQKSAKKRPEEL